MELLTQIQPVVNVTNHVDTHFISRFYQKNSAVKFARFNVKSDARQSGASLLADFVCTSRERNFLVSPYGH